MQTYGDYSYNPVGYVQPVDISISLDELEKEMKNGNEERIDSESGDLLFAVINFIRFRKRHAEDVLADTNAKFNRRFRFVEANMQPGDGIDEMEKLWQQVKKYEKEV